MKIIICRSDIVIYMIYACLFKLVSFAGIPVPYFMVLSFSNTLIEYVLGLDTYCILLVLYSIAFLRIIDAISTIPSLLRLISFRGVLLNGSFFSFHSWIYLHHSYYLFFQRALAIFSWSSDL